MNKPSNSITFKKRDFKGSRLRCLMLTGLPADTLAIALNELVSPHAIVDPDHLQVPRGFLLPDEAKLGETPGFLSDLRREEITSWWLEETRNANTPNWDLVSQCRSGDRDGLILVEAKSHEGEFHTDCDTCGAKEPNATKIRRSVHEANEGWNRVLSGFSLSSDSHYQLSNRFAFAWKLATMGIPCVLVYLGFLDAHEMDNGRRRILRTPDQWRDCVLRKSKGRVPVQAWDQTFDVAGVSVTVLVRSIRVGVQVAPDCTDEKPVEVEEIGTIYRPHFAKVPKKGNCA